MPWRASRLRQISYVQLIDVYPTLVLICVRITVQFSPISGKVVSINEELAGQPSLLNKSPEDKGASIFIATIYCVQCDTLQVGFAKLNCPTPLRSVL